MIAHIGLGSNVGDRLANLRRAVRRLSEQPGIVVRRTSSVYDTDPVGTMGRNFLNAVVEVDTTLNPHELLDACQRVERLVGRRPRYMWGPREVDLDVLLHGDETVAGGSLRIPHPQLVSRAFVLVPLAEIAPDAGFGRCSVAELVGRTSTAGVRLFAAPSALR